MILFTLLGMIGSWQIVLIILIVLLLFGGKKIPGMMRGLGQGIREFKNAVKKDDPSVINKEETN